MKSYLILPSIIGLLAFGAIAVFSGDDWAKDLMKKVDPKKADEVVDKYKGDATS